jgi:hypothetical protein
MIIGNTERYVVLRKEAQDPRRIPTDVAEFETITSFWRKHSKKGGKVVCIGLEVGWQLKEDRSDLVTE